MKRTPLKRNTPLKARKHLRPATQKTIERNGRWRIICVERAQYLGIKYDRLICEYSGETIRNLTTVADDPEDAWGHHIDGDRDNCDASNCYMVKYKYHRLIHDNNIKVQQEDFQGGI